MGSLDRKVRRAKKNRPRKFVYIGEIPEGAEYRAHPQGGIIVVHPDHQPVWHRPDGTKQVIKP